jgi:hypothetical protein
MCSAQNYRVYELYVFAWEGVLDDCDGVMGFFDDEVCFPMRRKVYFI